MERKLPIKEDDLNCKVTYKMLLRFFIPLVTTPLIITSTHTIIDAGLARLPLPIMSLAVFSIVKTMTNMVKAPTLMVSQAVVSLTDDRRSYNTVKGFSWSLGFILALILAAFGFTPLGGIILRNIVGIRDAQETALAYSAMRIVWALPLVEVLRNTRQGLAIGLKKTIVIPIGTVIRLAMISIFLLWAINTRTISGAEAGSLVWTGGIAIEGIFLAVWFAVIFKGAGKAAYRLPARNEEKLSVKAVIKFFTPLAVMMVITASVQTIILSGIAGTPVSPATSVAAYGVTTGLIHIIASPCQFLHQCPLVYTGSQAVIRRFSLFTGIGLSFVIIIIAVTPIGNWLISTVISAPEPVADMAVPLLFAYIPYPFLRAWREYYWGILLRKRDTRIISFAKICNAATILAFVLIAFGAMRGTLTLNPAVIGVAAFVTGELVESIIIRIYAFRNIKLTDRKEKDVQNESMA